MHETYLQFSNRRYGSVYRVLLLHVRQGHRSPEYLLEDERWRTGPCVDEKGYQGTQVDLRTGKE